MLTVRLIHTLNQMMYIYCLHDKPVLSISSTSEKINLAWDKVDGADTYEVYRYSYDETSDNAKLIATVSDCAYEDSDVEAEIYTITML